MSTWAQADLKPQGAHHSPHVVAALAPGSNRPMPKLGCPELVFKSPEGGNLLSEDPAWPAQTVNLQRVRGKFKHCHVNVGTSA